MPSTNHPGNPPVTRKKKASSFLGDIAFTFFASSEERKIIREKRRSESKAASKEERKRTKAQDVLRELEIVSGDESVGGDKRHWGERNWRHSPGWRDRRPMVEGSSVDGSTETLPSGLGDGRTLSLPSSQESLRRKEDYRRLGTITSDSSRGWKTAKSSLPSGASGTAGRSFGGRMDSQDTFEGMKRLSLEDRRERVRDREMGQGSWRRDARHRRDDSQSRRGSSVAAPRQQNSSSSRRISPPKQNVPYPSQRTSPPEQNVPHPSKRTSSPKQNGPFASQHTSPLKQNVPRPSRRASPPGAWPSSSVRSQETGRPSRHASLRDERDTKDRPSVSDMVRGVEPVPTVKTRERRVSVEEKERKPRRGTPVPWVPIQHRNPSAIPVRRPKRSRAGHRHLRPGLPLTVANLEHHTAAGGGEKSYQSKSSGWMGCTGRDSDAESEASLWDGGGYCELDQWDSVSSRSYKQYYMDKRRRVKRK